MFSKWSISTRHQWRIRINPILNDGIALGETEPGSKTENYTEYIITPIVLTVYDKLELGGSNSIFRTPSIIIDPSPPPVYNRRDAQTLRPLLSLGGWLFFISY